MLLGIGVVYRIGNRSPAMDGLIGSWIRTHRMFAPLARHTSLLGHELYKTLAVGRGALVLLAALHWPPSWPSPQAWVPATRWR